MIGDFLRALGQLADPRFLRIFLRSILMTAGLLVGLLVLVGWAASLIPDFGLTLWGVSLSALDEVAGVAAFLAATVGALLLMPAVAAMFIGLFLEDVADAVEDRHWPALPPAGRLSFLETLGDGAVFAGALILANLLGLVLWPFAGPFAPLVFLAVNGWLLGRQFFELAAGRRLGAKGARALRRKAWLQVWLGGMLMALGLATPGLNLAIPVLGVAAFTHTFHRVQARA